MRAISMLRAPLVDDEMRPAGQEESSVKAG